MSPTMMPLRSIEPAADGGHEPPVEQAAVAPAVDRDDPSQRQLGVVRPVLGPGPAALPRPVEGVVVVGVDAHPTSLAQSSGKRGMVLETHCRSSTGVPRGAEREQRGEVHEAVIGIGAQHRRADGGAALDREPVIGLVGGDPGAGRLRDESSEPVRLVAPDVGHPADNRILGQRAQGRDDRGELEAVVRSTWTRSGPAPETVTLPGPRSTTAPMRSATSRNRAPGWMLRAGQPGTVTRPPGRRARGQEDGGVGEEIRLDGGVERRRDRAGRRQPGALVRLIDDDPAGAQHLDRHLDVGERRQPLAGVGEPQSRGRRREPISRRPETN